MKARLAPVCVLEREKFGFGFRFFALRFETDKLNKRQDRFFGLTGDDDYSKVKASMWVVRLEDFDLLYFVNIIVILQLILIYSQCFIALFFNVYNHQFIFKKY